MGGFLAVLGLSSLAAFVIYDLGKDDTTGGTGELRAAPGCRGVANPALAQAIAQKWGPIFGCPVATMLAIARIESGYRPDCNNLSVRALSRGGAWGMWQQTLITARGHAKTLALSTNPAIAATMAKWKGRGSDLLDPDICGMFAAKQLGELTAEFSDFALVAGGYHQGAGKIRSVLAQGGTVPDDLPPLGKIYVTRALEAHA